MPEKMKKTDIKTLLKQGLTGAEVGKLFLKDMLYMYQQALVNPEIANFTKEPEKLFTQAEMNSLINSLKTSIDIQEYNEYIALFNLYLRRVPIQYDLQKSEMEIAFWKLYFILNEIKNAEDLHFSNRFRPVIMTQKQYNELKEKDRRDKLGQKVTIADVIISMTQYYIDLYQEGRETKYNPLFEQYKTEKIMNSYQLEYYWAEGNNGHYETADGRKFKEMTEEEITAYEDQDGKFIFIDERAAPEDATKYNILEYVKEYYENTGRDDDIKVFKADYPDIFAGIVEELTKVKGCKTLKNTPIDAYLIKEVSINSLYEAGIGDYIDYVDTFIIDGRLGAAVLQEFYLFGNRIDENGYYQEKEDPTITRYLIENIKESMGDTIKDLQEEIKESIRFCFTVEEAFNIIAERIELPEINLLLLGFPKDKIKLLNDLINDLPFSIHRPGLELKDIERLVDELITPIRINDLKPDKENIEKARRIIRDMSFFKGDIDLHLIIKGTHI
jgi:hypothetical protein